jgi:hypothetical protein
MMPDAPAANDEDEARSEAARANEANTRCFMTGSREEARRSGAARVAVRQRYDAICVNGKTIGPLESKNENIGNKQMTAWCFNQCRPDLRVRKSGKRRVA